MAATAPILLTTAREVLDNYGLSALVSWPLPVLARYGFASPRSLMMAIVSNVPEFAALSAAATTDEQRSANLRRALIAAATRSEEVCMMVRALADLAADLDMMDATTREATITFLCALSRSCPL